jgi:hypothetical protein
MFGFRDRPTWLGGNWPELDAEITVEEIPDETADDSQYAEIAPLAGTIDNNALIAALEAQLSEALMLLQWQGQTIAAAKEFVTLVGSTYAKTGEPVFKTTQDDDSLVAETLNYRFSDLAALLNQGTRPVPPKLKQGTVH